VLLLSNALCGPARYWSVGPRDESSTDDVYFELNYCALFSVLFSAAATIAVKIAAPIRGAFT